MQGQIKILTGLHTIQGTLLTVLFLLVPTCIQYVTSLVCLFHKNKVWKTKQGLVVLLQQDADCAVLRNFNQHAFMYTWACAV